MLKKSFSQLSVHSMLGLQVLHLMIAMLKPGTNVPPIQAMLNYAKWQQDVINKLILLNSELMVKRQRLHKKPGINLVVKSNNNSPMTWKHIWQQLHRFRKIWWMKILPEPNFGVATWLASPQRNVTQAHKLISVDALPVAYLKWSVQLHSRSLLQKPSTLSREVLSVSSEALKTESYLKRHVFIIS